MQNLSNQETSIQQAMKLAKTETGQQLIRLLQQTGGDTLRLVMEKAAAGDYNQAKTLINSLMQNPEAQKLLKQMGESYE